MSVDRKLFPECENRAKRFFATHWNYEAAGAKNRFALFLHSGYPELFDLLNVVKTNPGVLTVLKPFSLSDKEELPEAVSEWKSELDSLNLPEHKK